MKKNKTYNIPAVYIKLKFLKFIRSKLISLSNYVKSLHYVYYEIHK